MSDFVFRREGAAERMRRLLGSAVSFVSGRLPRQASRGGGRARGRLWAMKWFILVFALIFAVEAVVYLLVIPSLQRPSIIWSGARSYSSTELSRAISPLLDRSWMKFGAEEAGALLSAVPGIEDVQVVKRFPDKVFINVTERVPVAMTFVSSGGRTVPVQVDRNGVLFAARPAKGRSVPLVSGIPVENEKGGMRIPAKYRGLMEQISAISALSQNYFAAISEICVVPKDAGNYELVLYPIHGRTRILTGRELTEEALQHMMVALDVVNALEPDVVEIDLRYGSIAYRTRRGAGDSL